MNIFEQENNKPPRDCLNFEVHEILASIEKADPTVQLIPNGSRVGFDNRKTGGIPRRRLNMR